MYRTETINFLRKPIKHVLIKSSYKNECTPCFCVELNIDMKNIESIEIILTFTFFLLSPS